MPARLLVLDTNIVLDAFVFSDPAALPLRAGLEDGSLQWIATPDMRVELARVLGYPQIVPRLAFYAAGRGRSCWPPSTATCSGSKPPPRRR